MKHKTTLQIIKYLVLSYQANYQIRVATILNIQLIVYLQYIKQSNISMPMGIK